MTTWNASNSFRAAEILATEVARAGSLGLIFSIADAAQTFAVGAACAGPGRPATSQRASQRARREHARPATISSSGSPAGRASVPPAH